MRRRRFVAGALALAASLSTAAGGEPPQPEGHDLAALAAASRARQQPIVLFFTTPGCPYCAEVRRNYLAPRLKTEAGRSALLLREVDITGRALLTDFDGRATTEAALAARYGVRIVPVVMAFDGRGRPLGEPLVGLDRAGFYDGRLQALLDTAAHSLAR